MVLISFANLCYDDDAEIEGEFVFEFAWPFFKIIIIDLLLYLRK